MSPSRNACTRKLLPFQSFHLLSVCLISNPTASLNSLPGSGAAPKQGWARATQESRRERSCYFKETVLETSLPFRDSIKWHLPTTVVSLGRNIRCHMRCHIYSSKNPLSGCHYCHFPDENTVAREMPGAAWSRSYTDAEMGLRGRWPALSQGGGREHSLPPLRQPPRSPRIINTRTPGSGEEART